MALCGLLRLTSERRKKQADNENDREPDQSHEHLGGGWLAGSLAERQEGHQRPGRDCTGPIGHERADGSR